MDESRLLTLNNEPTFILVFLLFLLYYFVGKSSKISSKTGLLTAYMMHVRRIAAD